MDTRGFESDFEDLLENYAEAESGEDYGEYDEAGWDERSRRPSRRPLRLPPRGNVAVKRPPSGFATKAELDATARRLDGRIATNTSAIKALDSRSHALQRETSRIGDALRKEIENRKKEAAELKRGLDESRQMAMILPLISDSTSGSFGKLLPILLYSGGLGGLGGSSGGSDNNSGLMIAALAMAFIKP